MQIDIKCSECGKRTLNFDIGGVYYLVSEPSKTVIVENNIICPKCSSDISSEKCLVRANELLISFVAANISLETGKVPKHLQKIFPCLNMEEYKIFEEKAKSKLRLVEKL
jgi:hypothetical protein